MLTRHALRGPQRPHTTLLCSKDWAVCTLRWNFSHHETMLLPISNYCLLNKWILIARLLHNTMWQGHCDIGRGTAKTGQSVHWLDAVVKKLQDWNRLWRLENYSTAFLHLITLCHRTMYVWALFLLQAMKVTNRSTCTPEPSIRSGVGGTGGMVFLTSKALAPLKEL